VPPDGRRHGVGEGLVDRVGNLDSGFVDPDAAVFDDPGVFAPRSQRLALAVGLLDDGLAAFARCWQRFSKYGSSLWSVGGALWDGRRCVRPGR